MSPELIDNGQDQKSIKLFPGESLNQGILEGAPPIVIQQTICVSFTVIQIDEDRYVKARLSTKSGMPEVFGYLLIPRSKWSEYPEPSSFL